jgi:L-ribulokinase
MGPGFDAEYYPNAENAAIYQKRYDQYKRLGNFLEQQTNQSLVINKSELALQTS